MPPRKLINNSRGLGTKSRSKKTEPAPTQTQSDTTSSLTPTVTDTSPKDTSTVLAPAVVVPIAAKPYTGLAQVSHGLTLPTFDPNSYFSQDLFTDSSPLTRTTKEDADSMLQSIEEKRLTVKVATANIQLNQDVVRAGNEYLKLEGLAIDYAVVGLNNEAKYIGYQTAEVNRDIADNRYQQSQERLLQGQKTLVGMQSITPLIDEEWQQRKSLKVSQINSLKIEATKAKEALEPRLMQLSQNFRQELDDLN